MDAATQKSLNENPVLQIMYDSFMDQYKDEPKAFAAINHISEKVVEPGCKLIHLGNIVFLITVAAAGMVEMHAMMGGKPTADQKLRELDKQLDKLLPILKELGVKIAFTYMTPDKVDEFRDVLKEYKFYEKPTKANGKKYVAFYVEV